MKAYYNEHDPKAAAWLRELIKQGHIAPGVVDERSIADIKPAELAGYTQCHFFAGIGVWSYALRRAGWPDDRPVWTGSCPCQPFSAAGKAGGFNDERHLWPHFHYLIEQCAPDVVFGEQVASKDGLAWLDLVQADLEATGYAVGATDMCAAGFGAPHIRQRLWFVGHAVRSGLEGYGRDGNRGDQPGRIDSEQVRPATETGGAGGVVDPVRGRHDDADEEIRAGWLGTELPDRALRPGPTNGFWGDADWLGCRDGKWRPVEPGTFPLAHGAIARVVRLRGYGNAINAEVAQAFIESYLTYRAGALLI